jgi:acetolactate synthase-1/3 small subunit
MSDARQPEYQTATISVLVDNEAGVLARVIGLFSGRGYNIDSLTVAPVDTDRGRSRINVVTSGTPMVIEQIKAQLDRLVPVYKVADLTRQGPHVAREMALVKIISTGENRVEALRIAEAFRARTVDTSVGSFVFELTGALPKSPAPASPPWHAGWWFYESKARPRGSAPWAHAGDQSPDPGTWAVGKDGGNKALTTC